MKIKLNNEISVEYPESFAEMTGAELKKSFGSAARRSGAKNDAKQFFISVSIICVFFFRKIYIPTDNIYEFISRIGFLCR